MSPYIREKSHSELVALQIKWLLIIRSLVAKQIPFVKIYAHIVDSMPVDHPERKLFHDAIELARNEVIDDGPASILAGTGIFDDHVIDILDLMTKDTYAPLQQAVELALEYLVHIKPLCKSNYGHDEFSGSNGIPLKYSAM